jgi:hypothetical protein
MPARWPPTLTLRGPWAADVTYEPGDVVPDGGQTWRAVHRNLNARPPSSAWTRQVPGGGGGGGDGALLGTISDVQFHEADKLNSTSYVAKSITAASDMHGGSGRPAESVVIDKTADQTIVLTAHNLSGSRNLHITRYTAAGAYILDHWIGNPGDTTTETISGASDEFLIFYFEGAPGATAYGDFEVKVDTATNLVGPPPPPTPPSGGETVVTYPTPPLLPPREELEAIVGTGTPFTDLGLVAADFAVPTPPIARLQGALDNAGISRLRGAVKALHTGTHVIATLPYALSPFRPMRFAIPKGSGSLTVLTIGADNKLTVTANANDILYFDGVHFPSPNYGYVSGTADLVLESPTTFAKTPGTTTPGATGVIVDGCGTVKGRNITPNFDGSFGLNAALFEPPEGFPINYLLFGGYNASVPITKNLKPEYQFRLPHAVKWTVLSGHDAGQSGGTPDIGHAEWFNSNVQFQEEQPYVRCVVNITDAPYHPTNVYRICVNIAMIGPDDESWYVGGTDS